MNKLTIKGFVVILSDYVTHIIDMASRSNLTPHASLIAVFVEDKKIYT
jgi:hypothetical protein